MEQNIDLADLNGVDILFKNDLHDLGQFVLSALEARWAETRGRFTVGAMIPHGRRSPVHRLAADNGRCGMSRRG